MLKTFAGTITAPGATGNQSYTGVGFRPKVLLFFSTRQAVDGASGGITQIIGMATSSTNRAVISIADRNVASPTEIVLRHDNTKCITGTNTAVATAQEAADLVSLDADGFTLDWTAVLTSSVFGYLAIGGDGLTNALIKEITSPASTGSQSYTGVGFRPDALVAISIGSTTSPPMGSTTEDGYFNFGVASKSNQAAASFFSGENLATSDTSKWLSTSNLIAITGASEVERYKASLTSMDNDGFTLNWTATAGSGAYVWVLCLKGLQASALAVTQKTSTGNQSYTGATFTPKGMINFGAGNTASTVPAAGAMFHMGATTGTANRYAMSQSSVDGANPSNTDRRLTQAEALVLSNENGTLLGRADLVSFDAGGLTLNWLTSDGTGREFIIFVLGNPNLGHAFHTFS